MLGSTVLLEAITSLRLSLLRVDTSGIAAGALQVAEGWNQLGPSFRIRSPLVEPLLEAQPVAPHPWGRTPAGPGASSVLSVTKVNPFCCSTGTTTCSV